METFIQSIVSGLLTGSLYAMIGVGLTVIFGVMRIINMAHGDMVMLGMYGAFLSVAFLKIDPFLSIIVWFPIAFLLGALIYRFLLKNIVPAGELNTLALHGRVVPVHRQSCPSHRDRRLPDDQTEIRSHASPPFRHRRAHPARHCLWNGDIDHHRPVLVPRSARTPAEPSGQRVRSPKRHR